MNDMIFEDKDSVNLFTTIQNNFGEFELGKQVGKAELLYKKYNKKVNIMIALAQGCKPTIPEGTIKSEADFTIKVAVLDE